MKLLKYLFAIIIIAFIAFYFLFYPKMSLITGYSAKNVCSCTFMAKRDLKSIEEGDNGFSPINLAHNVIDFDNKTVTSTVYGLKKMVAKYRKGYGCTLVHDKTKIEIAENKPVLYPLSDSVYWPYGKMQKDTVFPNIDYDALNLAIDNSFDKGDELEKRTRAVVVVYKDRIIGEKYADGFSKETPLIGWSMTKSLTNAMIGVLVKQGKINIEDAAPVDEWKNDDRKMITWNNLLHMDSGLEWEEDYSKLSDATKMLFLEDDMGYYALSKPLEAKVGEKWEYSSGTSNLLARLIKQYFNSEDEYLNFPDKEIFDKLGMNSMRIEVDGAGNFVGSSYSFATARDWSKFGLLYLHNGIWNGERILPDGWVDYSTTPSPKSNNKFGAHFWINIDNRTFPDLPSNVFNADGYQGQRVFIFPTNNLVIVRLGLYGQDKFDFNKFASSIYKTIKTKD